MAVTVLALFIVMLTDPIRICIAASFAFVGVKAQSLSRWHWVGLATFATVFVVETTLHMTQAERQIFPALATAIAASLFHVLIATWLFGWIKNRQAKA